MHSVLICSSHDFLVQDLMLHCPNLQMRVQLTQILLHSESLTHKILWWHKSTLLLVVLLQSSYLLFVSWNNYETVLIMDCISSYTYTWFHNCFTQHLFQLLIIKFLFIIGNNAWCYSSKRKWVLITQQFSNKASFYFHYLQINGIVIRNTSEASQLLSKNDPSVTFSISHHLVSSITCY